MKEEPLTEGNQANHYDSTLEIKQEELHIMDVCHEEDFQDDMDTNPSDQFDLSHGQNSTFPNSPDSHDETASSTNKVLLDPNDLQTCLFVLRASETFIGEIGQMNKTASSSKSFLE